MRTIITEIIILWYYMQSTCYLVILSQPEYEKTPNKIFYNETYLTGNNGFIPESTRRNSRFLSFNNDASNLKMEVVFSVPFLTIPVGGNHYGGDIIPPKIDVNLNSILTLASILMIFIIPKMLTNYQQHQNPFYGRIDDPVSIDSVIHQIDEILTKYNIDSRTCLKKVVCWTLNKVSNNVKRGNSNGLEKIINSLMSMFSMKNYANVDPTKNLDIIEEIIEASQMEGKVCERYNQKCPFILPEFLSKSLSIITQH